MILRLLIFFILVSCISTAVKLDEKFVGKVTLVKERTIVTVRRVYVTWDDIESNVKRGDSVFLVCGVPDTCDMIRIKKAFYIIR